ncbi:hypothetical protein LQZ19_08490 [Treponema primitia]|uniref:hypothetical protein n=1 Tax=Treponema primitia TaxID=88058 RepID=UPI00397EAA58
MSAIRQSVHRRQKVIRHCAICGCVIFEGVHVEWQRPDGEIKDEGIDGSYDDGAGECELCGRELCADCGGFDHQGVCQACRGDEGDDD